jgi:hypothetical protein
MGTAPKRGYRITEAMRVRWTRIQLLGGGLVAYQQHQTREHGVGGWSRARWIVIAAVVVAVAVVVVVALAFSGGSGGSAGY